MQKAFSLVALLLLLPASLLPAQGEKRPAPSGPAPRIAWGAVVKGLQAGLAFDNRPQAAMGERVTLSFYLRNRSGKTLRLMDYEPVYSWPIRVRDRKGAIPHLMSPPVNAPVTPVIRTLRPGQTLLLGHPSFLVQPVSYEADKNASDTILHAAPGRYRVRQFYHFDTGGPGFWKGELLSGELELEVLPAANTGKQR